MWPTCTGESRPEQHGYFTEGILRKYRLVSQGRAGLVVDDLDALRQASLVSEHQGFARERRVRLI
jgi:hypothetical protein